MPNDDAYAGYAPYSDEDQPPIRSEHYRSTLTRAPTRPLYLPPRTVSELTGPLFGHEEIKPGEADLAHVEGKACLGQLIVVTGRVSDEDGRPVPETLVEVWQANAAGKYNHPGDGSAAPLDPGFAGCGRCLTDEEGRYRFLTIKPGAYPVPNSGNWWRPPHIHFSLFGPTYLTRLVSQLYFPGDVLNGRDRIMAAVPSEEARERLTAVYDPDVGIDEVALGYSFDIVLRGRHATPMTG